MVLMAICGELGAGKTLSLTYLAFRNYCKGRKIFSNYTLAFEHERIEKIEDIENIRNGFFAGDELWLWLDARSSLKEKNRVISSILLKSRKRDVHIAYTTQSFKQIDKRIRNITDFIAIPMLSPDEKWCKLIVMTNPNMSLVKMYKFRTEPYFSLYDTTEEIKALE